MTNEINSEGLTNSDAVSHAETSEKFVPQSKVNELIKEKIQSAKEKGYRQALEDFQKSSDSVSVGNNSAHSRSAGVDEGSIKKIVSEALQDNQAKMQEQIRAQQAQQVHQQTVSELAGKINDAAKKIPDYADTLSQVGNFAEAPAILHYANKVDNAGEVLYELAKYPHKAAQIISLINAGTPTIAESLLRNLSKSIKDNNQSSGDKLPDEPLSQLRPSNIGIGKAQSDASNLASKFKGKY